MQHVQAGREKVEQADAVTGNKVLRLAAAVEGVLRCSNNLLERLHHSYFMYLQPNPNTFITIETYILPASLMLLGLFLLAVSMLMPTRRSNSLTAQAERIDVSLPESVTEDSQAADVQDKVYPEKVQQSIRLLGGWPELSQGFCKVLAVHSACAVAGLVLHWALAQCTRGVIHRLALSIHTVCRSIIYAIQSQ